MKLLNGLKRSYIKWIISNKLKRSRLTQFYSRFTAVVSNACIAATVVTVLPNTVTKWSVFLIALRRQWKIPSHSPSRHALRQSLPNNVIRHPRACQCDSPCAVLLLLSSRSLNWNSCPSCRVFILKIFNSHTFLICFLLIKEITLPSSLWNICDQWPVSGSFNRFKIWSTVWGSKTQKTTNSIWPSLCLCWWV